MLLRGVLLGAALLGAILVASGQLVSPSARLFDLSERPTAIPVPTVAPLPTGTSVSYKPSVRFSGRASQTSDQYLLDAGSYTVNWSAKDLGPGLIVGCAFSLDLISQSGQANLRGVVDTTIAPGGSKSFQTAMQLSKPGTYVLDVNASDCTWTVDLNRSR